MKPVRQEIHSDTTRTGLWMHTTVPRMFNVCRIPQPGCDVLRTTKPSSTHRNKVIVLLHDWIYAIDVYDGSLHNIGHKEIERRLRNIVLDAKARSTACQTPVPISVLSSDERDVWAKVSLNESSGQSFLTNKDFSEPQSPPGNVTN